MFQLQKTTTDLIKFGTEGTTLEVTSKYNFGSYQSNITPTFFKPIIQNNGITSVSHTVFH
jgi:hypothetical protein